MVLVRDLGLLFARPIARTGQRLKEDKGRSEPKLKISKVERVTYAAD
jgi:hypothetical protein